MPNGIFRIDVAFQSGVTGQETYLSAHETLVSLRHGHPSKDLHLPPPHASPRFSPIQQYGLSFDRSHGHPSAGRLHGSVTSTASGRSFVASAHPTRTIPAAMPRNIQAEMSEPEHIVDGEVRIEARGGGGDVVCPRVGE